MTAASTFAVQVEGLKVGYGSVAVLHGVDLDVRPGEFVAILGSSGCGKTTLLRSIAGFQPVSAGAIRLHGRDVAGLPPEKRGLAMMFQSYALWPHMTVLGNVGYGLRLKGMSRQEIGRRVAGLLDMLNLVGLEDRKVTNLSGGQRQRVALGRALAVEPSLLLLDEPLSNLDAKLRLQMRYEIKALQAKLGFAAILVTHDREEAMTMADRIVVMDAGRIVQVGTPEEVYDKPVSPFVARFMGADNTLDLQVEATAQGVEIRVDGQPPATWRGTAPVGAVVAYFRDDIARLDRAGTAGEGNLLLDGTVEQRAYPGGHYRYGVSVGDRHVSVTDPGYHEVGSAVRVCLPLAAMHLFPRGGHA
ncbi:ABC transporter ATP-binding protein [Chelatococcus sp. SYSU_G07232]|uniref:ABC transporter ATP-binding protein n=1 Tax=Chelatococcus albus TaxID=3047466 RepID=A0ABT7AKJ9_9HYPH|nr:ABC transporter ATP-binding protein [Chelatococcus sp. SYSU_G07232]MDJ1159897.1 ABC transporter ATP-binding protein [Chelatococcus sp. SYSU_G07232]